MAASGARLRKMIDSGETVLMPNVWDGFSARLVESMGFKAALVSGAGLSESRWGKPDLGIMGFRESLEGTRMISDITSIPLIADADTGYGNAMNVYNTIVEFEKTGVAGVMIEDQVWPKRCGHVRGKEVIPADEMVEKVRAAVDARKSKDLLIKARTDAAGPIGIAEAIKRANMYLKAGADFVFADALLSAKDIGRFAKEVNGPVAVNMGFGIRSRPTTPLLTPKQLHKLGVSVIDYGRITSAAAIMGMRRALEKLIESEKLDEPVEHDELLVSFDELQELMDYKKWIDIDNKYEAKK
ncbi:MAG: isocitrate lyase/PEP mutase family protein [Candidatus Marsarchaeota archaeon]|nr:isocitrate lyase/PEP mutase family protein [Candidatus Marsarchaeota archaeon]